MSSFRMSIPEHIDELRVRLIRIIICIAIITIFTMSFSIKTTIIPISLPFLNPTHLTYLKVYYPYPEPFNNIALQLTTFMRDTLLPSEVKFIQTAPGQVFFGQIYLSLLIGLTCSLPIVIKEIYGFVSPAFNQVKRKGETGETSVSTKASSPSSTKIKLVKILLPTFILFVFGLVFSYVLVIPWTLDFLYSYGESIGAEAFLTVNDFITFVLQFVLGFGIAFQLPIIMYVLSLSGLTDSKFWQKNFRYAIIIITIFGAVITPDGSGITMWFVALPMIALYAFGIIAIRRNERKVVTAESS